LIKALLIKRLVAVGMSVAISSVIPFLVHDKPRIKWVWDKAGPMIIDAAQERIDARLEKLE
jgi:hypothetical protein